MPSKDINH